MTSTTGFGIDIGGSGIKGAPVDLATGELLGDRMRVDTPQPSKPKQVAEVLVKIIEHFGWQGPVGVALPCVIKAGTALTAANVDKHWQGTDATRLFAERLGRERNQVVVLNDADAAGLAEINNGAGVGRGGVVLLLTFGTGIGSALFLNGKLIPNTEFGHLEVDGRDAEDRAAASAKEEQGMSWHEWAKEVSKYLRTLENLLWPDLIIVGGGVSRRAEKWLPLLDVRSTVVPAALQNNAGIVGAAAAAASGIDH